MTFSFSLEPDQALQNGPDLDPNCFKVLMVFLNFSQSIKKYAKVTQYRKRLPQLSVFQS